jgi:hypothetical protein
VSPNSSPTRRTGRQDKLRADWPANFKVSNLIQTRARDRLNLHKCQAPFWLEFWLLVRVCVRVQSPALRGSFIEPPRLCVLFCTASCPADSLLLTPGRAGSNAMRTAAEYRAQAKKKLVEADRDDGNSLTPSALEALRALADGRPGKPAVVRQLPKDKRRVSHLSWRPRSIRSFLSMMVVVGCEPFIAINRAVLGTLFPLNRCRPAGAELCR